jgi:SulP family sulfate permease
MKRFLPILDWFPRYTRVDLVGDGMAGAIVAIMLVPQSMAYAMLAGLPAQVGLYASLLPLVLYAALGTSRTLAVGPVAMVSLLVATGVSELAPTGTDEFVALAIVLALMVGVIQLGMGLLRLGFLTSLLSHNVLSGFTSGAALIIGASQVKHLFGIQVPRSHSLIETLGEVAKALPETRPATLAIGAGAVAVLLAWPRLAKGLAGRLGAGETLSGAAAKAGPFVVVLAGTLAVTGLGLAADGVSIVGEIPRGLPSFALPSLEAPDLTALLPTALLISLVGFMESVAVAKALAARRREKIDANQELIALGVANLGGSITGAYPVTGGFSRSVVNFDAGARTGLASVLTATLVALTLTFLTPLLHDLPRAVLAAIVVVAVAKLVDVGAVRTAWRYSPPEALALLATFATVITVGIETGILVGVAVELLFYLWRTYRPHVAVVGRVPGTEHYRNVERHEVETCPAVAAVRVDENLFFLNASGLEQRLMGLAADSPELTDLVLICSAVNRIDSSALEVLESLARDLADAGVRLHLAEVKGPVMDGLRRTHFLEQLGEGRVHLSTHAAMEALGCHAPGAARPAPEPALT